MTLSDIELDGVTTLLLDRDGVINRLRHNDYVKCWEEFEFLPGVMEALSRFAASVPRIFVVTNQRGVGKGLMTESDLKDVHDRMCEEIRRHGGRIDGIYYCTSLTDADPRRKPGNGMFLDIMRDYPDVDPAACLMVGDSESDMQFAANSGIRGVKVDAR